MRFVVSLVVSVALFTATALMAPAISFGPAADSLPALPKAPGPYTGPKASKLPDPEMQMWAQSDDDDDVHHQCGAYALVFRNKDLREKDPEGNPDEQGYVYAQGTFYIQFQAVGQGSSEVERFSFSFGASHPAVNDGPETWTCNDQVPDNPMGTGTGGAYLLYYRSDFNADDGFFVPIKTTNVPDGTYAAAVHAYNAAGDEVARAWTMAVVDNCPTDLPGGQGVSAYGCAQDTQGDIIANDHTLPWPMILPGDGTQTNDVDGLTVDFPEPMIPKTVEIFLNGEALKMEEWTPPPRDSDLIPLNDEDDCPNGQEIKTVCERMTYCSTSGEPEACGFKWLGDVQDGDVIRVLAEDQNFNRLERTVHVGATTSGGTVELLEPDIAVEVLNDDDVFIRPGDFHEFNIRVTNVGGAEAVTGFLVNTTTESGTPMSETDFDAWWTDLEGNRVDGATLAMGEERDFKVRTVTKATTPSDHYFVVGTVEFDRAGQKEYRDFDAIVDVNPEASGQHQHLHTQGITNTTATNDTGTAVNTTKSGDTPAPGLVFGLAAMAAAAIVLARRKDE